MNIPIITGHVDITIGELVRHLKKLPKDAPVCIQAFGGGDVHEIPLESVVYLDKANKLIFTNMRNTRIPHAFIRVDARGEGRPLLVGKPENEQDDQST